jgi:hypothetical protein
VAACWLKAQDITSNNPYNPTGVVNRQQMAAFLWRFAGGPSAPASCGFTDETDVAVFARVPACWLKATDITTNNPYRPTSDVTWAQMAAFLYRLGAELNLWVRIDTRATTMRGIWLLVFRGTGEAGSQPVPATEGASDALMPALPSSRAME